MSDPLTCIHVSGSDGCIHVIARSGFSSGDKARCTLCNRRGHYDADGWLRWETHLCPTCQSDYEEYPSSYLEFGAHQDGIVNWQALQAELAEREPEKALSAEEIAERNRTIPF